jgi:uncharacterized membrane protein YtjA (UPF0391 family)
MIRTLGTVRAMGSSTEAAKAPGAVVAAFLCQGDLMLYWAVVFLIIALVAAVFGFGGIAVAAAGIAKFLFFLFVVIFLIMLVLGLMGRRSV